MKITVKKVKLNSFLQASGDPKIRNMKYYPGAKTMIMAPLDPRNGEFPLTGLTPDDETRLEQALGYDKGTLNRTSKFWKEYSVTIPEDGIELDTELPIDELKWKVLGQSKLVAKTLQELYEVDSAEFVMTNATQEADVKNKKRDVKMKAFARCAAMSLDDYRDYLTAKGIIGVETLANSRIQDMVESDAEDNPKEFLALIEDPNYKDMLFIANLVNAGIIFVRGTRYTDAKDSQPIAANREAMIDYINHPKNGNIVMLYMNQLEKLKGGEITDKAITTKNTKTKN